MIDGAAADASSAVSVPTEFAEALRELGLVDSTPLTGEPLTGGVSSDIWRIDANAGPICVKRALAKLRVAADWRAPIERNLYEARWMRVANEALPGCAPQVLGQHPRLGVLAMSYLPPSSHLLWKQTLRKGEADPDTARAVGRSLARIHSHSAAHPELAAAFATDAIFFDIRLEPYLLATSRRHSDLAAALEELVRTTQANARALVHGDVSPKNILIGPHGPVFLDAECAWWGDPAFDLAFCLNHLLLKCLWTPAAAPAFLEAFGRLRDAYRAELPADRRRAVETRAARLLPGLFLARVDGKSPVEYITDESDRARVRAAAMPLIRDWPDDLMTIRAAWARALNLTGAQ